MTDDHDVAVIGAGVVGLCCALNLQRAGRRVALFDPLPPGNGCSFGSAGLINVEAFLPIAMPGILGRAPRWLIDPLGPVTVRPGYALRAAPWLLQWIWAGRMKAVRRGAVALRALNQGAFDRYRELLGAQRFGELMRQAGGVHVFAQTEGRNDRIARELRDALGVESQALGPDDLRAIFPGMEATGRRGLLFPRNGHTVSPLGLTTALAELFLQAGGTLRREKVMTLIPREGGGCTLLTNLANPGARTVVVAAGAWSRALLDPLGVRIPLETERGYHLLLEAPTIELPMALIDKTRGLAMTPMNEGLRLAGTVEIAGLDAPPNPARALNLKTLAKALFPRLGWSQERIWMGFRPSLPDSVAAVGVASGKPWLFVAVGHGHDGFIGAPATGRLIGELVTGARPHIDPAPYGLQRFARG